MQSFDSIELVSDKEEIKCNNIIKRYKKMMNVDDLIKEETKEHNPNWPKILDHPYRLLATGGSGSGKSKVII